MITRSISKYSCLAFLALLVSCSGMQQASQPAPPVTDTEALISYQDSISMDYLEKHLSVFAADSMKGRNTGTEGLKKAADYLADQYKKMGLQPVGDDSTYFQHFSLNATQKDSVVYEVSKIVDGKKTRVNRSVAARNSTANFVEAFGATDSLQGKIVFAGFGVNDSLNNIHHLDGVDLKDKWVMVFQDIPTVVGGDTLISPAIDARTRFRSILSKGAEGILLIPGISSEEFQREAEGAQTDFGRPTNMRLPYLEEKGSSGGFDRGYNLIHPELAAQILQLEDKPAALANLREKLLSEINEFTPENLNYALTQIPYSQQVSVDTKNVLAFYEGADPKLKNEVVVLTSHHDHVGIGAPDSTGDRIYNGADDDGSGTIGLLNVAKAFTDAAKKNIKPKRSILFLNVSAEEKGLLGSRYYSDHPVIPIDSTVANVNVDMIGRVDPIHQKKGIENYVYIIGSEIISSDMDSLLTVANKQTGELELNKKYNDLQDPNQFYRRSDHWNFGRLGVPFTFFFSGVHEDYHRPSDEVGKINFDKMARTVETIYGLAVHIANADQPPQVDNQEFIEITKED